VNFKEQVMIYRYEIAGKIIRVKGESQSAADAYIKLVYGWPAEELEDELHEEAQAKEIISDGSEAESDPHQNDGPTGAGE
jgi:hypothetical protein